MSEPSERSATECLAGERSHTAIGQNEFHGSSGVGSRSSGGVMQRTSLSYVCLSRSGWGRCRIHAWRTALIVASPSSAERPASRLDSRYRIAHDSDGEFRATLLRLPSRPALEAKGIMSSVRYPSPIPKGVAGTPVGVSEDG